MCVLGAGADYYGKAAKSVESESVEDDKYAKSDAESETAEVVGGKYTKTPATEKPKEEKKY